MFMLLPCSKRGHCDRESDMGLIRPYEGAQLPLMSEDQSPLAEDKSL